MPAWWATWWPAVVYLAFALVTSTWMAIVCLRAPYDPNDPATPEEVAP